MSSADDVRVCIADGHEERKGKTLCGRDIASFVFRSIDHWLMNRLASGRLVGCDRCLEQVEHAIALERDRVSPGAWGPVFVVSVDEDDREERTIGYYDDDESCEDCESSLAIVLQRDGSYLLVSYEALRPCPDDVWEAEGFDPTLSLMGKDQTDQRSAISTRRSGSKAEG